MKKRVLGKMKPVLLLAASAVLLLMSTVGSTRAALTYYSDYAAVQMSVSSIGVSLVENEKVVSHRNYDNDGWSSDGTGQLLEGRFTDEEKVKPGKRYEEKLQVFNSGVIDTYVRVILCRSWMDAEGNKDTTLTPALIGLELASEGSGWMVDESASTPERTILYYTRPLASGESTPAFCDAVGLIRRSLQRLFARIRWMQREIRSSPRPVHMMATGFAWMRKWMQCRPTARWMPSRVPGESTRRWQKTEVSVSGNGYGGRKTKEET